MKPILFCDFDGTICYERYWRSLPSEQHTAVQELLFQGDTTVVQDWMRGHYTAEQVNQFAAEALSIPYPDLWELFVHDCQSMQVSSATLSRLNELRTKYTVILMTGNMDSFTRFTVPALSLENYFDHISNSYDEGVHKTDNNGAPFLSYAERYGADINDCVLLDDSIFVCDIFRALGGNAKLVTSTEDVDYHLASL